MKGAAWIPIVAIPLVLLFWLYTRTPGGDAQVRRTLRSQPASSTTGDCPDPKLGSPAPVSAAAAALGKASPGKRGWLVVNMAECASCLLDELLAWRKAAERHGYAPAFVTASNDPGLQGFRRNAAFAKAQVVLDTDRKFSGWLGACFGPRAYVFDPNLRLTAIQQEPFPDLKDPFADPGLKKAR